MYTVHIIKYKILDGHLKAPEGKQLSFFASKKDLGTQKGGPKIFNFLFQQRPDGKNKASTIEKLVFGSLPNFVFFLRSPKVRLAS